MSDWYNKERVAQKGSVVLNAWREKREAERQAAAVPVSDIRPGTEAFGWLTGGMPGSGRPVSERTAMSIGAVYACVALIGGALASLTLETYKRVGRIGEAYRPDLWWVLNEEMHPRWAAPVAWEFGAQSLLLHGDLFMRIGRRSRLSPNITTLKPYHALQVDPQPYPDNKERLLYYLWDESGEVEVVDQDDMIHVPGPGFDGRRGMSQIRYVLRHAVSLATAGNEQANSMLDNMRPDLVLTQNREAKKLEGSDIDSLRKQWLERYSGPGGKNGAPVILTGGMDIKQISITPQDAQLLELLQKSVEDTARIFGIPPFMIGYTDKTTGWGSGVEQMGIGFVKYTLQRHLVKIEQELNRKIYRGNRDQYVEFDTETLERGDLKSRLEAARIAFGRAGEPGWMTRDEVRRIFNLPASTPADKFNEGKGDAPKQNPPAAE
ncbi:phage portal protein [Cupriavidus sp. WS]|uniref:phage portal protein n=1 Tax=Cupriavidus sp. WS TaxID=1312922 RepID=UPI00035EC4D2|nr:phage portal protein [Cupriavidus sp. WS]